MPKQRKSIKQRAKEQDGSTGRGREHHGKHREHDEGLAGSGSSKGGLNREASRGTRGVQQNASRTARNS